MIWNRSVFHKMKGSVGGSRSAKYGSLNFVPVLTLILRDERVRGHWWAFPNNKGL